MDADITITEKPTVVAPTIREAVRFDGVGKLYRRQDEIGTPFCITVDVQSLEDHQVTIRDRDSMEQVRVEIGQVKGWLQERVK